MIMVVSRALPGLKPDGAVVFLDDDGMGNGQALACAFPNVFGGEEWIEDFGLNVFRYPGTGIDNADFDELVFAPRTNPKGALLFGAVHDVGYGMRCIDNQIEDDLVKLARDAGHRREIGSQVGGQIRNILPFVLRNQRGALDGAINVHHGHLDRAWVGELSHGTNDRGDVIDPLEQLFNRQWYFSAEVFQVNTPDRSVPGRGQISLVYFSRGFNELAAGIH